MTSDYQLRCGCGTLVPVTDADDQSTVDEQQLWARHCCPDCGRVYDVLSRWMRSE